MEWKPIDEAPKGTVEIVAVDARTGAKAITQHDDLPHRRGFRHRNGFHEATHFLDGIPPIPMYTEDEGDC